MAKPNHSSLKVEFLNFPAMKELFRFFPGIFNSEMNKSYQAIARSFMSAFEKQKLVPGIYNVKRTFSIKRKRNQPKLTKKALFAGFRAAIFPTNRVHGKELRIRAASPLLKQREFGEPIRPNKSDALYIRGPKKGRKGKPKALAYTKGGTRATRAKKFDIHKDITNKLKRERIESTDIVARKQQVYIKPVLGFRQAWRRYEAAAMIRLQKGRDAAMKRAMKKKDELFARGEPLVKRVG